MQTREDSARKALGPKNLEQSSIPLPNTYKNNVLVKRTTMLNNVQPCYTYIHAVNLCKLNLVPGFRLAKFIWAVFLLINLFLT